MSKLAIFLLGALFGVFTVKVVNQRSTDTEGPIKPRKQVIQPDAPRPGPAGFLNTGE